MEGMEETDKRSDVLTTISVIGIVLVLILGILIVGSNESVQNAGTQNQSAQAGAIRLPDAIEVEPPPTPEPAAGQSIICSGSASDPAVCTSKYFTKYVSQEGNTLNERFCKLSPNVVDTVCKDARSAAQCTHIVDQLVETLTEARGSAGVEGVGQSCNDQYRGALTCFKLYKPRKDDAILDQPDIQPPTPDDQLRVFAPPRRNQLAAALLAQSGGGDTRCCKANDQQCLNQVMHAVQAGGGQAPLVENANFDPDNSEAQAIQTGGKGQQYAALTDSANQAYQDQKPALARGAAQEAAADVDARPTDARSATAEAGGGDAGKAASSGGQQGAGGQGDAAVAANGSSQSAVSPGNDRAVTGNGQVSSNAPLANDYQPGGQSSFQSLQPPEIFQPKPEASTRNDQSREQPNFIERFMENFAGGNSPFFRQTPQGIQTNQPAAQQPAYVYVEQPPDPHIRNVQAIAYDVGRTSTEPTDTRVQSFEKTLTAIGGVHTSGRNANVVNREYGTILDLITQDQAIKALEVAEDTGERVKNRVFCSANETADSCLARRNEAAKRVERETFVRELQKSDGIRQADLEHFLAIYDGWVSPEAPQPTAEPVKLSSALNNADAGPVDEPATTTPTFASWTWNGVRDTAKKAIDALLNWLKP